VREHAKQEGLGVSPALDLLVPSINIAWKAVLARGAFVLANGDERALKDRVAKVVVDVVTRGEKTDPHDVAEAAVRTIFRRSASLSWSRGSQNPTGSSLQCVLWR
jgi:hypothetical protein